MNKRLINLNSSVKHKLVKNESNESKDNNLRIESWKADGFPVEIINLCLGIGLLKSTVKVSDKLISESNVDNNFKELAYAI